MEDDNVAFVKPLSVHEMADFLYRKFFLDPNYTLEDWNNFRQDILEKKRGFTHNASVAALEMISRDMSDDNRDMALSPSILLLQLPFAAMRGDIEMLQFIFETWPDAAQDVLWFLMGKDALDIDRLFPLLDVSNSSWLSRLSDKGSGDAIYAWMIHRDDEEDDAVLYDALDSLLSRLGSQNQGSVIGEHLLSALFDLSVWAVESNLPDDDLVSLLNSFFSSFEFETGKFPNRAADVDRAFESLMDQVAENQLGEPSFEMAELVSNLRALTLSNLVPVPPLSLQDEEEGEEDEVNVDDISHQQYMTNLLKGG